MSITVISNSDSKDAAQAPKAAMASNAVDAENNASADETNDESNVDESSAESDEAGDASETTEESEGSDSEEGQEGQKDEDKKPKKKGGFQKRIARFHKQLSEKDLEIERLRGELTGVKNAGKPAEEKPVQAKSADEKPKPEDFDTNEDYVEALTDWKISKVEAEKERKAVEAKLRSEIEESQKSYQQKVKDFANEHEDFDDVLESVSDIKMPNSLFEEIRSSELGPKLAYELSKNRKEFERIAALPERAAIREVWKFEESLKAKSESEKPSESKQTKAPAPIRPVTTGATGSVRKSITDPNLSQSEYESLRKAQLSKKTSSW